MADLEAMQSEYLGRWLLSGDGIERGYLRIEEGNVVEVCEGNAPSGTQNAVVLPAFVNAHTHLGDSVAYPAPKGTLQEIVCPPDGYKFRVLRAKPDAEKAAAMRAALDTMARTGTALFSDFREEGLRGVRMLKDVLTEGAPKSVILGRPLGIDLERDVSELLGNCEGLGMSAISDWPYDFLKRLSAAARSAKKMFSIHVSESTREDIDSVLDLRPDFVIHMTQATDADVRKCVDAAVPIVVCPRSNGFFGWVPNIPMLLKLGATVGLGTDNGMISMPDMVQELKAAFRAGKVHGGILPSEAVNLATFGGQKVLNAKAKITTEISRHSDLVVIRVGGDDPLHELVTGARSEDIAAVVCGGRIGGTSPWR